MTELPSPVVLVIMGVSGSGKSTIAALLSERLGWTFEEGDSLHPKSNVEKMAAGIPLTDEDRWPWLAKVADWIDGRLDTGVLPTGQVTGVITEIPTVADLIARIIDQAEATLDRLAGRGAAGSSSS